MNQLDPEVRWITNAANLATGTRFAFEQNIVGDYVEGYEHMSTARIPLAAAAAFSAAVSGAFSSQTLPDLKLPCRGTSTVSLVDGGAYDNTGLEAIDSKNYDDVFLIALTAGGVFQIGGYNKIPLVSDLTQSNSSLYRQSRTLRRRSLFAQFKAKQRAGVLFKLNTEIDPSDETPESLAFAATYPEASQFNGTPLAEIATSFDRFDRGLIELLVYHGWWLTGRTMAAHHPTLNPLPAGTKPPPS